MDKIKEMYTALADHKDDVEKGELLYKLCCRLMSKDPATAKQRGFDLMQLGERLNNLSLIGKAHIILGRVHHNALELEQAEQHYLATIECLRDLPDDRVIWLRAKMAIAMIHWAHSDHNEALALFTGLLPMIGNTEDDLLLKVDVLTNIGHVYERLGELDRTEHYYLEALDVVTQTTNTSKELYIMTNLAILKRQKGELDRSLEELKVCLYRYQKQNNKQVMATIRINMAGIYCDQKLYAESLTEYQVSMKLLKDLKDERTMALVYSGMSEVYYELRGFEEAQDLAERAIELANAIGIPTSLFDSLMALSKALLGQGKVKEARARYQEAVDLAYAKDLTFALKYFEDLEEALAEAS